MAFVKKGGEVTFTSLSQRYLTKGGQWLKEVHCSWVTWAVFPYLKCSVSFFLLWRALVVWSCVECESRAGMWWPVLCPWETPFPCPVCPPHCCLSSVFPQLGSSRVKEGMFAMSGWRRRDLAASPELLHTRRWVRSMRSSLHREEFFLQCVGSRSRKRKRGFFAGGEEKQSSKRREESINAFQREVNCINAPILRYNCPFSPDLFRLLMYLPCENGFQKLSGELYSTLER